MTQATMNFKTFKAICLTLILSATTYCFSQNKSENEPIIEGKLLLSSAWEPVVYLSHIPTFKDMFTMSNDMIIAESKVDSSGIFQIPVASLPKTDNLYRLHISKKDAPAASLIIGGKEENHIFLIANSKSKLQIANSIRDSLFYDYKIEGSTTNAQFRIVDRIIQEKEELGNNINLKKDFLNKTLCEQLRHIADTSSHPLVSLYALYHSKYETSYLTHQEFFTSYLDKWKSDNSTYFKELRSTLPMERSSNSIWYFLIIAIGFSILGYFLNNYLHRKTQNTVSLNDLSVQERKIFLLIKSGKSNKEISEEYNIGLSTVKSHVSSIYAKLNIKSRKEAMNLK